jgi:hypothetical protein
MSFSPLAIPPDTLTLLHGCMLEREAANSVSLDSAIRAVQQQQSVLNTVLRIRITIFFNRPPKTPAPIFWHFNTNKNKHFTHIVDI